MSPLPPGLPPEPPWAVGWPGPGSSCSCWNFPSVGFGSCTEKQGGGGWAGQAAAPHRAENESRRASSSSGSAPFLFSVLQLRFQPWPCTGPPGPAGLGQPTRRDTRGQGHPPAGTSPPGMGRHWDRDTTGMGTPPGAPGREPGGCCLPGWWGARAALQDPRGLGGSPLGAAALGLSEGPVPMPQAGLAPRGAPHRLGGCSLPGKAAVPPEPGGCGVTLYGVFLHLMATLVPDGERPHTGSSQALPLAAL